ncbi:Asp-tRNA(Asn)/Glu-tRNA(Gln) amidotransferase subunit GatA [Modestobacter sp. I12A-02628]|uniref:Glutamyl-tRNA(Gln) amidotransferase subunit A n=1 Tax=Goekera deserti TaxID=2497753 RepID=A0A7K3WGU1_9ACTN|nr:Asp-tRNA(Asn)/Glu-tRNA(Gln) amidotransferase subunit GatA [Goekera deserti]MPQ97340.1 Asp-tRNA(Asn)/Glu-tRNA(Gln) amidotransferase subunit GatA [Goekera deserti]NDI50147.1 Asp-tRNA(Asn)/Glu-tRNA(Gln) amidotransferase subunit GatA [Goekera deserti]NEL55715.1 Asp-tRNA(Asn)/Glu-tRNA(Gln) amidotransferase subunit GatA [Goekera deserti]
MTTTPAATDLTHLDAAELGRLLGAGEVSAVDVTRAHLDRIAADDGLLHAYLHVDGETALATAAAVDAARAAGDELGPLAGVPVALKDVVVTEGVPTTSGSRILEGWRPPYDATVAARLKAAGTVLLGKTNMDEFAMGSSTENSAYGVTRNPWDPERIPGGSSGGSSAAVAGHLAPWALGTDTGGSIRQPAALTGLVGHKPTYGSVSRYGLIAFSSSLDQAGPMARTVLDAAVLHEAIGGHDPRDSTSIPGQHPLLAEAARLGAGGDLTGVRIGVVRELGGEGHAEGYEPGVLARVAEALAVLEGLGAEVREVSCPSFDLALAAYYLIAPSEASSNLSRFDGVRFGLRVGDDGSRDLDEVMALTREQGFGAEVKRRIILGTYALSSGYYEAYYGQAQKVRTLIGRDFASAFGSGDGDGVDVLVSPTTPTVAFPLGARVDDPIAMYAADLCTLPASLAGTPAISVPCGLSDGLPVGFQIMAPTLADDRCYRVAAALEAAQDAARGHRLLDELAARRTTGGPA